jgi:hypothetical protein
MQLVVDETEKYAYLRTLDELPEGMPRLARRHSLTFGSTVLLILLREELTTAESDGETPRVIVTTAKITEWMRAYRRDGVSEDRVNGDINALVKLGYLRRLRGSEDTYEARRIIKALVTADWLAEWRGQLLLLPAGDDVTDREDTLTCGAETSEDLAADELAEAHT